MENQDYINTVRSLLLQNKKPSYQASNRNEVRVRCPYCGDSKDPSSAHLYIEMKPPFRFHCFKCDTAGVLNQKTLRDLGIFNNQLSTSILESNKTIKNNGVQKISYKRKNIIFPELEITQNVINNVNYFNSRYSTNLDAKYIENKFKCILNAPQFFKANNIYAPIGRYDFEKSIGFLSSDASHIVFRDITGLQKTRYNNLNISPNTEIDTSSKIYNIKGEIDIMNPKVKLVITEGIFDIIGVYLHFYKDTENEKNTIFAAACGKSYNAVILNYIRKGFLDLDIVIYSDADVDVSFYKSLKENSLYLKNSRITIFYNTQEKDFGIPKNRITLRKAII